MKVLSSAVQEKQEALCNFFFYNLYIYYSITLQLLSRHLCVVDYYNIIIVIHFHVISSGSRKMRGNYIYL